MIHADSNSVTSTSTNGVQTHPDFDRQPRALPLIEVFLLESLVAIPKCQRSQTVSISDMLHGCDGSSKCCCLKTNLSLNTSLSRHHLKTYSTMRCTLEIVARKEGATSSGRGRFRCCSMRKAGLNVDQALRTVCCRYG